MECLNVSTMYDTIGVVSHLDFQDSEKRIFKLQPHKGVYLFEKSQPHVIANAILLLKEIIISFSLSYFLWVFAQIIIEFFMDHLCENYLHTTLFT